MTASQFEELAHLYEKSFEVWPYRRDVEQYSVLQALGDVTGLAALDLGCTFVGFEIDPGQVAAANARLAAVLASRAAI